MSFVSLGGDGSRPTFFELVAAERLMPSLKAATVYSLSVCLICYQYTYHNTLAVKPHWPAGICAKETDFSPLTRL